LLRPFSNAPRKKKNSHFRKMEIVGLAEKPKIKFVVDIWGPDHPSGASIDSGAPFVGAAERARCIQRDRNE